MPIKVISQINDPGLIKKSFSEDLLGTELNHGVIWLLDGASASSDQRLLHISDSDATWLVQTLALGFQQAARQSNNVKTIARKAIETVKDNFKIVTSLDGLTIPTNALPAAAGVLMKHHKDTHTIDFLNLGDCSATVMQGEQIIGETTPTLDKADEEARIYPHDKERQRAEYHEWKKGMNKPGGYWIFSLDPKAANHANIDTITLSPDKPAYVLIMSDGLERLTDTFSLFSKREIIRRVIKQNSFKKTVETLRDKESSNFQIVSTKLPSKHDDASGILLEITSP